MSKPYRAWRETPKGPRWALSCRLLTGSLFFFLLFLLASHMPHNQLGLEFGLASEGHEAQEGQLPAVR